MTIGVNTCLANTGVIWVISTECGIVSVECLLTTSKRRLCRLSWVFQRV